MAGRPGGPARNPDIEHESVDRDPGASTRSPVLRLFVPQSMASDRGP